MLPGASNDWVAGEPAFLLGEEYLLPLRDQSFSPINVFAELYGWWEAALSDHVLDGARREFETGAEFCLGDPN